MQRKTRKVNLLEGATEVEYLEEIRLLSEELHTERLQTHGLRGRLDQARRKVIGQGERIAELKNQLRACMLQLDKDEVDE